MKVNAFSLLLSALVAALSLCAGGQQANAAVVQKPSHGLLARASSFGTEQSDEDLQAATATYEGKTFLYADGFFEFGPGNLWQPMGLPCTADHSLLPYDCARANAAATPSGEINSGLDERNNPQFKGVSKRSLALHKNAMLAARSKHLRKRGDAQPNPQDRYTIFFLMVEKGQWIVSYLHKDNISFTRFHVESPCQGLFPDPDTTFEASDGQPARGYVKSDGKEDNRNPSDPGLSSGYHTAKDGVKQGYEQAKDGVKDAYSDTKDYLSNKYEGGKHYLSDKYEDGKNHLSDMYEGRKQYVSDKYNDAKDDVKDASNDVKNFGDYVHDLPGRFWNGIKKDYEKQTNKEQQPHPNNEDD